MAKRITIYKGDALERLLSARATNDAAFRSASGVLNAVADRYLEAVRRATPRLTQGEWCLLWDSLNGVWMADNAGMYVMSVTQGVSDSITLDGLDRKWSVDGSALVGKLAGMSYCELMAVVDSAERFWARDANADADLGETVRAIVGAAAIAD